MKHLHFSPCIRRENVVYYNEISHCKRRRTVNSSPSFQNILFDLDGTLTASHEGIIKCVQYALSFYGIEAEADRLFCFIGPPLLRSFMEHYGFSEEQGIEAVEHYRVRYNEVGYMENRVYDGILPLLEKLKAAGKHLLLATSKPYLQTMKILNHFGLAAYFEKDFVLAAGLDDRLNNKASIIGEALAALERHGISREGSVMVGDRIHDIEGARKNQIPVIGVEYGYAPAGELKEAGADYIVSTVEELGEFLLAPDL